MAASNPGIRLVLWPKRWLYVALVASLVPGLHMATQIKWAHSFAVVALLLLLVDAVLRHLAGQRMTRFTNRLMAAIADRRHDELLPMYRGELLLRFSAPKHDLFGNLGLIHGALGDHTAAAAAYREAMEEAPPKVAPVIAHRLADALYAAGEMDDAEKYYRFSQDAQHINPGVRARIARLIMERGGDIAEAEQLLREAVEAAKGQAGGAVFRCLLVEVLIKQGKVEDATWQLQVAEEEIGDRPAELQRLEAARQALASAEA